MELINVCGGLECSTLRLNFSYVLFKNYNNTSEFEVSDVLCTIKLYTNTLCFETNPVASVCPLPPRGVKKQQTGKTGVSIRRKLFCYRVSSGLDVFPNANYQPKNNNKKCRGKCQVTQRSSAGIPNSVNMLRVGVGFQVAA